MYIKKKYAFKKLWCIKKIALQNDQTYLNFVNLVLTFCATCVTQWEVQLLRSGPFGFHVPLTAVQRYKAIPVHGEPEREGDVNHRDK